MKYQIGDKFGMLTLIERVDGKHAGVFRCECGKEKQIRIGHVTSGVVRSCGCVKRKYRVEPGQQFGRLTVVAEVGAKGGRYWALCHCECGDSKEVSIDNLVRGHTRSCGCLVKEQVRELRLTHGEEGTKLYGVWHGMKARCEIPSAGPYSRYGARGIKVCPDWSGSYIKFRNWAVDAGYRDGLQIDRIDNDGDYEPSNCRFVTPKVNANNRGNHVWLEAFGERKTMSDWSRDSRCAVSYTTLKQRIGRGMAAEVALTRSVQK